MPKLPASWWDEVFDGKVHHLKPEMTPYGTIASLRTSVYREAAERGIKVTTKIASGTQTLSVQLAVEPEVAAPSQLQRLVQARAQVKAAGLDSLDQDLVEERLYCTCGLGNAAGDQHHDPGCKVWG